MNKLEVWKDIEDYPNYQISTFGNVKSKERISPCCYNSNRKIKERILKQYINKKGYLEVCLFNKTKRTKKVHQLVAKAFIPNPENKPCINHMDGNKQNNKVDNLEWCSYSYNVKEAYRLGLSKPNDNQKKAVIAYCKQNKIKPIVQLDLNNNLIKKWNSAIEVEETLGFSRKNISQCITGRTKTAYGYIWKTQKQFKSMEYEVE